jgi:tetratricopeptide (TPR) repeat protein
LEVTWITLSSLLSPIFY